jgi:hypothetical protein
MIAAMQPDGRRPARQPLILYGVPAVLSQAFLSTKLRRFQHEQDMPW